MLKQLLKDRKEMLAKARGYAEREMDEETKKALEECMGCVKGLDERIRALESVEDEEWKQDEMEKEAARTRGRVSHPMKPDYVQHAEKKGFSIARAIADVCEFGSPRGIEKEVSQECALRSGRQPKGQFFVPYRLGSEHRDLTTTTGIGAIPTLWQDFIEVLRAKMIGAQAGVRYLEGLKSTTRIPRQSAPATAYWTGEQTAPTASNQTIDYVQLTSRMVGCQTQISRLFIMESLLNAESFVRDDLAQVIARALDKAIFVGDGGVGGVSPVGVLYTANVHTETFGASDPTWAGLVNLEKDVAQSNALFGSTCAYISSPAGIGMLKQTPKLGSTFPVYLLGEDGKINTYPVYSSTEIPADYTESSQTGLTPVIFGNWQEVLVGIFGDGLDVLVDPYSAGAQGDLRIYGLLNADVALRHPVAFAYAADMATS